MFKKVKRMIGNEVERQPLVVEWNINSTLIPGKIIRARIKVADTNQAARISLEKRGRHPTITLFRSNN